MITVGHRQRPAPGLRPPSPRRTGRDSTSRQGSRFVPPEPERFPADSETAAEAACLPIPSAAVPESAGRFMRREAARQAPLTAGNFRSNATGNSEEPKYFRLIRRSSPASRSLPRLPWMFLRLTWGISRTSRRFLRESWEIPPLTRKLSPQAGEVLQQTRRLSPLTWKVFPLTRKFLRLTGKCFRTRRDIPQATWKHFPLTRKPLTSQSFHRKQRGTNTVNHAQR